MKVAPNLPISRTFSRIPIILSLGSRLSAVVVLVASFIGCTTTRIDWQTRVGSYTYDQAVLELGPPDKLATLTDGTKVGEWLMYRGQSRGGYATYGGPVYGGPFLYHYAEPPLPDQYLRLTFGNDGILQAWRRVAK
jgi:hypothetical protein